MYWPRRCAEDEVDDAAETSTFYERKFITLSKKAKQNETKNKTKISVRDIREFTTNLE